MPPWERYQGQQKSSQGPWQRYSRADAPAPTPRQPEAESAWGSVGGQLARVGEKVGTTAAQIPYGVNEYLGEVLGAASQIDPLRPVYEAFGVKGPSRWLAEQLISERMAPEPRNTEERVAREAGRMLAESAPAYGGLAGLARAGVDFGKSLGGRLANQVLAAYRTAPARVAAGEVTSALGAGAGEQVAEEAAPGSTAARVAGGIAGGLAPVVAIPPAARLGYRAARRGIEMISPEARSRQAAEYVRGQLGERLSSQQARQGLGRAREIAQAVGPDDAGRSRFDPTLAQRTRDPALVSTQQALEKEASGQELDDLMARYARNEAALADMARREAPQGTGGAEAALEPLVRRRAQAAARVRGLEQQRAELPARRQAVTEQQRVAAEAARRRAMEQRLARSERGARLSSEMQAAREREREALEALRQRTTGRRMDVARDVNRVDRAELGARMRERILARRSEAASRMSRLSEELGIRDADVSVPYENFMARVRTWRNGLLSSQKKHLPETLDDARDLARRLEGESPEPVTFQDIKGLRESIVEEYLGALRATDPGHRKRLANIKALRDLVDRHLLSEDALGELGPNYGRFRRAYLEEFIEPFEKRAVFQVQRSDQQGFFRTLDEEVASRFLRTQDAARQYARLFGQDPEAMADFQAVVLDDLADSAIRDGVIQPRALESWLVKRGRVLEEVPGAKETIQRITQRVSNVEDAARKAERELKRQGLEARRILKTRQDELRLQGTNEQRRLAAQLRRLDDEGRAALRNLEAEESRLDEAMQPLLERMGALSERKMALEDTMLARRLAAVERGTQQPAQIIDDAITDPRLMRRVWSELGDSPDAKAAMQRHVWDNLTTLRGRELHEFLDRHAEALSVPFSAKHLKNLRVFADGLEMLEAVPPPRAGRPIETDPLKRLQERTGMRPQQLASRYVHVQRGRSSPTVEKVDAFFRWFAERARGRSKDLMKRALYDADVAEAIADAILLPKPREAMSRLRGWMFTLGIEEPVHEAEAAE